MPEEQSRRKPVIPVGMYFVLDLIFLFVICLYLNSLCIFYALSIAKFHYSISLIFLVAVESTSKPAFKHIPKVKFSKPLPVPFLIRSNLCSDYLG